MGNDGEEIEGKMEYGNHEESRGMMGSDGRGLWGRRELGYIGKGIKE